MRNDKWLEPDWSEAAGIDRGPRIGVWSRELGVAALTTMMWLMLLVGCSRDHAERSDRSPADLESGIELLNVSYDPTRELYSELNSGFARQWLKAHGQRVAVKQSHGGSGKQARSVIEGLEADVVTLALAYDIDAIVQRGNLLAADWQSRLPHRSVPFTSTIVFLVRKGNPKGIRDWDDIVKPGVQVVTANPKTSGGARWNYLAAWGVALKRNAGDESKARQFVRRLYQNTPVLDSGARGATTTFVERKLGDVLLTWESEALLGLKKLGGRDIEMVSPSISILTEPPVAVIDHYAKRHRNEAVAKAYVEYLYTPDAQATAARQFFRPWKGAALPISGVRFAAVEMFTIDELFGGWAEAQKRHFDDGGEFDQLYRTLRR